MVDEVGESEARGTLEELAEVEGTHTDGSSDGFEAETAGEVVVDVGLGLADGLGLGASPE